MEFSFLENDIFLNFNLKMTRICLLGDTGSGKTIVAIFMLTDYLKQRFKVYSNIKLRGIFKDKFTLISNTGFINKVDENVKNIVLLDEVGRTTYEGRTHNAIRLGDLVTQSRKSIGEESHLIFTTQLESQLNDVLIGLSDYIIYPNIILNHSDIYPNIKGREKFIPVIIQLLIKVKRRTREGYNYFKTIKKPYYLEKDFKSLVTYYNTYEEVARFGDGSYITLKDKYKEYVGKESKIKELKIKLQFKDHLNISESDRVARAIVMGLVDD